MSVPAAKPYQMVPASTVINVRMSIPLDVNDGASPPAQSTDVGQVNVALPPFVTINVKEPEFPVAGGLVKVSVWFPDRV